MPELPEVETVRRTLQPIVGARVGDVEYSGLPLHMNKPVDIAAVRAASADATVEAIRRIGKFLLIDFAARDRLVVAHLGMTGRLRVSAATLARDKHTHLVWQLRDGRELRFTDARRFGMVGAAVRGREREHPSLAQLGIDPLTERITPAALHAMTRASRAPVKVFLLDQRKIAGLGNIYASEALHRARIRPTVRANRLSAARVAPLAHAIREVLEHALTRGGTSLRDFVNANGTPGNNREHLRVYDREGQLCPRRGCDGSIRRAITQGRATFYCPRCQHS